jgi:uncharacterized NAD(P)/FAD-binding protein YdhS
MSALPDDPGHFLRWAGIHHRSVSPLWFAPRPTYGRYLAASLREAAAQAPAAELRHVRASATAIDPTARGWWVRLEGGGELVADDVVLALGYGPPAPPAGLPPAVLEHPAYIADPWRPGASDAASGDVLCLGTGLTAVDAVLALADADLGRRIFCVSRTGLRPLAHRTGGASPAPRRSALRPVTRLACSARCGQRSRWPASGDWRDVVNGIRPHVNELWSALPAPERERFCHRLARFWEVHRHRMPPQIANRIERLEDDGQLRFLAARVEHAEGRGSRLRVTLVDGSGERRELEVGAVVNLHRRGRINPGASAARRPRTDWSVRSRPARPGRRHDRRRAAPGRPRRRRRNLYAGTVAARRAVGDDRRSRDPPAGVCDRPRAGRTCRRARSPARRLTVGIMPTSHPRKGCT